jgi:hypothetical protein
MRPKVYCQPAMIEPAYILHDGKKVPYVPIEIKTHRDAYAATLHVLFKHVADFHICIVKAFSKKYGIPEDDILQTIQESEEFKNMHVDPVLDPLGYLAQAPVQEPAPTQSLQAPVQAPVQEPAPTQSPQAPVQEPPLTQSSQEPAQEPVQEPVAKKRIIKKKTESSGEKATTETATTEKATTETATTETATTETATATTAPSPIEKRKVIRKKVTPSPMPTNSEPVVTDERRTDVIASVEQVSPIAHLLATNVPATQKKIIRKKINS